MNAVTISETYVPGNPAELLFNDAAFSRLERVAAIMASGKAAIPAHLRGSPGDCLAILLQSARWQMDPFAVAQKTFVINGTMGYEAQLVAAVINNSRIVQDRFHFEWFGPWQNVVGKFDIRKGDKGEYRVPGWKLADEDGIGIRVWATLRGESEPRELELLLAQAKTRNSTLWADDPKQQLAYLAQKRWARLYAPDVILGVYTPDELDEVALVRDMGTVQSDRATEQSRSVRERVVAGRQHVPDATLAEIMEAIENAADESALNTIGKQAAALPPKEQEAARKAFKARRAELRSAAAPTETSSVDEETGEITDEQKDVPDPSSDLRYADWANAIEICDSFENLGRLINIMPTNAKKVLKAQLEAKQTELKP